MKITAIVANAPDLGDAVCTTLTELGDEVTRFDLNALGFTFYSEDFNPQIDSMFSAIKSADGVAFVFAGANGLPDARLVTFLEYVRSYDKALIGKNCLVAGDTRTAVASLSDWLYAAGACDAARIAAREDDLAEGSAVFENVGRAAEDFYRIVRQKRKVVSSPATKPNYKTEAAVVPKRPRRVIVKQEILSKHEPITEAARRDVSEIAGIYARKFEQDNGAPAALGEVEISIRKPPPSPTIQTCMRLTMALTYHYKGDMSTKPASFQFHIDGDGGFDGAFSIQGADCRFSEGTHEAPDVTILCDEECWRDVLKGKLSAMKAFMVGRLKVRGNFVLLKRLDELFEFCVS